MISLLLPSRGRHDQLVEMWNSARDTAVEIDDVELVIRIDDDDDSYDDLRVAYRDRVHWVVGDRNTMSALWNDAWVHAHGDIFMHCADDIRFREPGWDLRVKSHFDKLPDRIAFVYGRDGAHDQSLGTHGFLSRQWTDVIGYFLPPYFSCDFADTWLNEVAESVGRRIYDPLIFTEHMHPAFGKGPMDQTHLDRFERDVRDNNPKRWAELAHERVEWAQKLRAAIG